MDRSIFVALVILFVGVIFGGVLRTCTEPSKTMNQDSLHKAGMACQHHGGVYAIDPPYDIECLDRTKINTRVIDNAIKEINKITPPSVIRKEV